MSLFPTLYLRPAPHRTCWLYLRIIWINGFDAFVVGTAPDDGNGGVLAGTEEWCALDCLGEVLSKVRIRPVEAVKIRAYFDYHHRRLPDVWIQSCLPLARQTIHVKPREIPKRERAPYSPEKEATDWNRVLAPLKSLAAWDKASKPERKHAFYASPIYRPIPCEDIWRPRYEGPIGHLIEDPLVVEAISREELLVDTAWGYRGSAL